MKKWFCRLLAVVFVFGFGLSTAACTPREETLKILNWADYMDNEFVKEDFKKWYKEKTGENVKVTFEEFDYNETMLTRIETQGHDFDIVFPSDYMIELMISKKLLLPIEKEIYDVSKDPEINDKLINITKGYDPDLTYSVPYVWGTLGIMYNTEKVSAADAEKMSSWAAMWDPTFKGGEMFMKNSPRDAYTAALLYAKRNELIAAATNTQGELDYTNPEYQTILKSIFTEVDSDSIALAKEALKEQRTNCAPYYKDDDGKELMHGGEATIGMFWSCDAGIVISDSEENGAGNKNLFYSVPKEGTNVWVDGCVIPTTAVNTKAANYFIKYLMTKEVSKVNAEYLGASTANEVAMNEYKAELEADEKFFNDTKEGFKEMYLDMMFPTDEMLERAYVMKDFGALTDAVNEMWRQVKSA